jgi:hypothetical protein
LPVEGDDGEEETTAGDGRSVVIGHGDYFSRVCLDTPMLKQTAVLTSQTGRTFYNDTQRCAEACSPAR